jgi:hypothetical protein
MWGESVVTVGTRPGLFNQYDAMKHASALALQSLAPNERNYD